MKIAARELNLLGITTAVVLLALTYLVLKPKFREWAEFQEKREELLDRKAQARQYLDSRESVESRLQAFRQELPSYPEDQKVEADLLPGLEQLADQQGLELTSMKAGLERGTNDLYEIAIDCRWDSDLPALVKFLYAQQSQGIVSDVRLLVASPSKDRGAPPGRLSGSFTMDYAYRRETGATENKPEAPAPSGPAEAPAQP